MPLVAKQVGKQEEAQERKNRRREQQTRPRRADRKTYWGANAAGSL